MAAVQMFPIVGPVAAAAHVLREERRRGLLGLVKRSWKLASVIDYQSGVITDLRAMLIKIGTRTGIPEEFGSKIFRAVCASRSSPEGGGEN